MLRRVVSHEVRSLFADRIVWVAVSALVLLTGYAVHVGQRFVEGQRHQVAAAVEAEAERYRVLGERLAAIGAGADAGSPFQDPTRPYVLGRTGGQRSATLPVSPFQVVAVGQSDLIPAVVAVDLAGADPRGTQEEIENPIHLMSGPLDLAFVVTFLLPLLVLALSFDLFSREREGGTLALLLSQPISPRTLMLGKALARWGLLFGVVLVASLVALFAFGGPPPLGRYLIWAGAVGVYLAFWTAMACLVNATGRSSARNAVALAFVWLVLVMLVPAGIQLTAGLLHPVPSRAELVGAERDASRVVQEQASAVLAQYYDDHPELLPEGSVDAVDFQTRAFAVEQEVSRQVEPVRARHRSQLERQREVIRSFRWLSPAVLVHDAQVQLAGTGDDRLARFEADLADFHAGWVEFFGPAIYRNDRMGPEYLDRIPVWEFQDEGTREVWSRIAPGLLGMLLLTGLAVGLTIRALSAKGARPWAP